MLFAYLRVDSSFLLGVCLSLSCFLFAFVCFFLCWFCHLQFLLSLFCIRCVFVSFVYNFALSCIVLIVSSPPFFLFSPSPLSLFHSSSSPFFFSHPLPFPFVSTIFSLPLPLSVYFLQPYNHFDMTPSLLHSLFPILFIFLIPPIFAFFSSAPALVSTSLKTNKSFLLYGFSFYLSPSFSPYSPFFSLSPVSLIIFTA